MAYLDATEGASRASGVVVAERTFVEEGAGTYTATVVIPAGGYVLDIQVHAVALWTAATSASLEIGDADDPDGYYTAVDLKATDLTLDQGISFAQQGGVGGAYLVSTHLTNIYAATARTITATVTSVGAGTAGRTRVLVLYALPSANSAAATFEA